MKKRKWTSQEKLRIVLEGLSDQIDITKLCAKYQIAQTLYYQWRDSLLKHGHQAFETKNISKKEQHLEQGGVVSNIFRTFKSSPQVFN